jgi:hypothetical protein
MESSTLERVQRDLDAMKASLSRDFPYDRRSVVLSATSALCGALYAMRVIPGWEAAMTAILLVVIAGLFVASGNWLRTASYERGSRPRRWSWGRQEAVAVGISIAALLAYVLALRLSTPDGEPNIAAGRDQVAGPAFFCFGIAMLVLGVLRAERRSFLGWGVAMSMLGLVMPWVGSQTGAQLVIGTAMAIGGSLSTALLWRQLRQWETEHVSH